MSVTTRANSASTANPARDASNGTAFCPQNSPIAVMAPLILPATSAMTWTASQVESASSLRVALGCIG